MEKGCINFSSLIIILYLIVVVFQPAFGAFFLIFYILIIPTIVTSWKYFTKRHLLSSLIISSILVLLSRFYSPANGLTDDISLLMLIFILFTLAILPLVLNVVITFDDDFRIESPKYLDTSILTSTDEVQKAKTVNPNFSDASIKPEEMVVDYVLDFLYDEYGFSENDVEIEFPIQMGSASKRADIVIFSHNMPHSQENIYIIIECKRADRSYKEYNISQLHSYMSACMNVRFGVLAASEWRIWDRVRTHTGFQFEECDYLPDMSNNQVDLIYNPPVPIKI